MAFRPNFDCQIVKPGPNDQYGRPSDGAVTDAQCGVVTLNFTSTRTSIRSDASATRGSAREDQAKIRLLFPPLYPIDIDDTVIITGRRVRVISIEPRYDLAGELDHNQVDCDFWQAG